jgi:hypothetical protein
MEETCFPYSLFATSPFATTTKEGGEAPKGACQPLSALSADAHPCKDAPAFRRLAAALPLTGLPPTGFNSGPRFLGRRPDAERPAFPILQCSELLAGRSSCRPGGVRVARERIANPPAGTALAPLSGVPSRRRPSGPAVAAEPCNSNSKTSHVCFMTVI